MQKISGFFLLYIVVITLGVTTVPVLAEVVELNEDFSSLQKWQPVAGQWQIDAKNRLTQTDTKSKITHIYTQVNQTGKLLFEFEIGYLGGLEDEYGGFGCHILIDDPTSGRTWGQNKSFLLWFTYDRWAYATRQFYFQIYRSSGPNSMSLTHPARQYPIPEEYFSAQAFQADKTFASPVKIKFMLDTQTGEGKLYTPSDPDTYFLEFTIPQILPKGYYFSFRTNNMAVYLDNLKITREPVIDPLDDILLDASLSSLSVAGASLELAFSREVTTYYLDVDNAVSSLRLKPDATGMVQINNNIVLSATDSTDIPLREGDNLISILVTAADAKTSEEYFIFVNRSFTQGLVINDTFHLAQQ